MPTLIAAADVYAIIKWRAPTLGAILVPKLPWDSENNRDDTYGFFLSFVTVGIGWCWLVFA